MDSRHRSACASGQADQDLHYPLTVSLDTAECVNREQKPGPSCSKLMMLLVNISLKLRSLKMAYTLILCKNTCESDIVLNRTVNP